MAPIDGRCARSGLLGSPAFEIPRASSRDLAMLAAVGSKERKRQLVRKTWFNLASMAGLIASRWLMVFLGVYVFGWTAGLWRQRHCGDDRRAACWSRCRARLHPDRARLARLRPAEAEIVTSTIGLLARRALLEALRQPLSTAFAGTPMRSVILRCSESRSAGGVRRRLQSVGAHAGRDRDEANLNAFSTLQSIRWKRRVQVGPRPRRADASVGIGCLVITA